MQATFITYGPYIFSLHVKLVRETAIQCLLAMSELPRPRIFPMKRQVSCCSIITSAGEQYLVDPEILITYLRLSDK